MSEHKVHLRAANWKKVGHGAAEVWQGRSCCGRPRPSDFRQGHFTVPITENPRLVTCKRCQTFFADRNKSSKEGS